MQTKGDFSKLKFQFLVCLHYYASATGICF